MSDIENNDAASAGGSDKTRDSRKRQHTREDSDSDYSAGQQACHEYRDPRVERLMQQVSALTDALIGNRVEIDVVSEKEDSAEDFQQEGSEFIKLPASLAAQKNVLEFGSPSTVVKESPIPKADAKRVGTISALQHFDSEEWSRVRYAETQKTYTATPAFVELEVNEELKRLDKNGSFAPALDRSLGALSNAILCQTESVRENMQALVNWAAEPGTRLTPSTLFDKIQGMFAKESTYSRTTDDVLQIVCGRRTECLQNRRKALLEGVRDPFTREGLARIPPSSSHLFNKEVLAAYIMANGGREKVFGGAPSTYTPRQPQPSTSQVARPVREAPASLPKKPFRPAPRPEKDRTHRQPTKKQEPSRKANSDRGRRRWR